MSAQADRIAAALRPLAPEQRFLPDEVPILDALGAKWEARLATVAVSSTFRFGPRSLAELDGVKLELRKVVELAITLTAQDFAVNQGLRSVAEQQKAVAEGHSRTMKSKHLPQPPDSKAWAADLVAWVDGKVSWEFDRYGAIAFAMDQAATKIGCAGHVRWGCAWDRVLSDFGGSASAYLAEAKAYAARHPGSDLLDAPHFEWVA